MGVTIKEIAKLAGVSPSTVSRALTDAHYVDLETAERVKTIAKQLGYRPNALARGLVQRKSMAIGLIIPEIENPFYSEIVSGVERIATQRGYGVVVISGHSANGEQEVRALLGRQVDGIIHAGVYRTDTALPNLRAEGVPVVLLGRKLPGFMSDCVVANDRDASVQLTTYLIQLGHTRIAYIFGKNVSSGSTEKLAGYKEALEAAGIPVHPELVEHGDLEFHGGHRAAQKLLALNPPPTAILAGNDFMALGAREAILEAGLRIPEDISLAGFDDILFSSMKGIELTTAAVPRSKMGQLGAELLIKKIEQPDAEQIEQIILEARIVRRNSCGPAR
ncbi:MAG: transcriptional regulator, LacI family [Firmicutes bacterium]|nr:transcriptional regulator, LacI family [Bacillota bacterium]